VAGLEVGGELGTHVDLIFNQPVLFSSFTEEGWTGRFSFIGPEGDAVAFTFDGGPFAQPDPNTVRYALLVGDNDPGPNVLSWDGSGSVPQAVAGGLLAPFSDFPLTEE